MLLFDQVSHLWVSKGKHSTIYSLLSLLVDVQHVDKNTKDNDNTNKRLAYHPENVASNKKWASQNSQEARRELELARQLSASLDRSAPRSGLARKKWRKKKRGCQPGPTTSPTTQCGMRCIQPRFHVHRHLKRSPTFGVETDSTGYTPSPPPAAVVIGRPPTRYFLTDACISTQEDSSVWLTKTITSNWKDIVANLGRQLYIMAVAAFVRMVFDSTSFAAITTAVGRRPVITYHFVTTVTVVLQPRDDHDVEERRFLLSSFSSHFRFTTTGGAWWQSEYNAQPKNMRVASLEQVWHRRVRKSAGCET